MNKILSLLLVSVAINTTSLECMKESRSAASSHYLSENNSMWLTRLNQEVWAGTFQSPKQHHSVEEFIGGLVRCAREGGEDAVIAFLEEAETWGFALDAVYYDENDGHAQLILRHLVTLNILFKDEFCNHGIGSLVEKIRNIHSIVSDNDVKASSFHINGACFGDGPHFGFMNAWIIMLEIPLSLSKAVKIDITRQHH